MLYDIIFLGDKMNIEIPNIQDYEQINSLAVKLHDLHVLWRPDIFVHTDTIFSKEELQQIIDNKCIVIAKENDKVVGYILIGRIVEGIKPGYKYRKELPIDAMIVDEDMRGKGIETKLLEYVIELAKQNNCTGIRLTVNEENDSARKLYEKVGMKLKNVAYNLSLG